MHDLILTEYQLDTRIIAILGELKKRGYKLHIASNGNRRSVHLSMIRKGFYPYIDYIQTYEDVKHAKPHPEIYFKCMIEANLTPQDTLILEDSDVGLTAARASGARVLKVQNATTWNLEQIEDIINARETINQLLITPDIKLNVVIPMAGEGRRFAEKGYTRPKPLIIINEKSTNESRILIDIVMENLKLTQRGNQIIFVVQRDHYYRYDLEQLLTYIAPNCKIVQVDKPTEGAACTILAAKKYIDTNTPLLIANCDQYLEWDCSEFLDQMNNSDLDGGLVTFTSNLPKWSYAKLDKKTKCVSQVAEKQPISNNATAGIYFWRKGNDFVKYAEQMIAKDIRTNNEFYTCPVYNEAIADNKILTIYRCEKMWDLGNPEDMEIFVREKLDKVL
jgi:HAD superfamily hydrolase (TIGR01509 family)